MKIICFSSIRSDYDLISGLLKSLKDDPEVDIQLIISGAHLSPTYGYTIDNIINDDLPVLAKIETLIDSNTTISRIKSASILLQGSLHTIDGFSPDLIIYAGDREDVIIGALIGAYLGIPTLHLFGGDHATDGNVDNCVRHATSKLSTFHFVAHEIHRERLIKIGENPQRIYLVGNPALDKFVTEPFIHKNDLLFKMGLNNWSDFALVIFHPIIEKNELAGEQFREILVVLENMKIKSFVSYPNIDAGNKSIIKVIDEYKNNDNFYFYKNLPRSIFINLMRNAMFMVGNSSAGLLEAPSIPLGVVNVGERQKGRLAAENVIFVDNGMNEITSGIKQVLDDDFQKRIKKISSPYGDGNSVKRIHEIIKGLDLASFRFKTEDPLHS